MKDIKEYFHLLEQSNHSPNFWCSLEYFQKANWRVESELKISDLPDLSPIKAWVVKDLDGELMLPYVDWMGFHPEGCFAGFSTMPGKTFLDYELIYDPSAFIDLCGSRWHMVRKNLRWAETDTKESLFLTPALPKEGDLTELLDYYFADDSDWYDPEVMLKYLYHGNHRFFLMGAISGKLYGVLAYDYNYKYINFRYCVVLPGIRGLSDTARVLFYRQIAQIFPHYLVNDGGTLGDEGLYKYKMRLNPVEVRKIYTYA